MSPAYRSTIVVTPHHVSTVARSPAMSDISIDDFTINPTSTAVNAPATSPTALTVFKRCLLYAIPGGHP